MAAARATASVSGMAGYQFVVVPYPVPPPGEWTDAQIDEMAELVAPAVVRRLLGLPGEVTGLSGPQ